MGTPQDKIPPLDRLFTPPDATRVSRSRPSQRVGWRDFVSNLTGGIFPTTAEHEELVAKNRLRQRIPFEGGGVSEKTEREIYEQQIQEAYESESQGLAGIYPRQQGLWEKYVPENIRSLIRPNIPEQMRESPGGKAIKFAIDLSGVTSGNPMEMVDPGWSIGFRAAASIPFSSRLYSRLDRAIGASQQAKATSKQWLATISKGVPAQENQRLKKQLEELNNLDPKLILTREDIISLNSGVTVKELRIVKNFPNLQKNWSRQEWLEYLNSHGISPRSEVFENYIEAADPNDFPELSFRETNIYPEEIIKALRKKSPTPRIYETVLGSDANKAAKVVEQIDENNWKVIAPRRSEEITIERGPNTDGYLTVDQATQLYHEFPDANTLVPGIGYGWGGDLIYTLRELEEALDRSPAYLHPQIQRKIDVINRSLALRGHVFRTFVDGYHHNTYDTFDEALEGIEGAVPTEIPPKWRGHTRQSHKMRDYSEIIAQLDPDPRETLFTAAEHWDVDSLGVLPNPIAHLRIGTREARTMQQTGIDSKKMEYLARRRKEGATIVEALQEYEQIHPIGDIEVRQIEELQSDWAQKIRRKVLEMKNKGMKNIGPDDVVKKESLDDMPEPDFNVPFIQSTKYLRKKQIEYLGYKFEIGYYHSTYDSNLRKSVDEWKYSSVHSTGSYIHVFHSYPYGHGMTEEAIEADMKMRIKRAVNDSLMADMPFKKSDQWIDLMLERALQDAIDRNLNVLTWSTGKYQYDLYGSELVGWKKIGTTTSPRELRYHQYTYLQEKYGPAGFTDQEIRDLGSLHIDQLRELVESPMDDKVYIADKLYKEVYDMRTRPATVLTPEQEQELNQLVKDYTTWQVRELLEQEVRPLEEMLQELVNDPDASEELTDQLRNIIEFRKKLGEPYFPQMYEVRTKYQHLGNVPGFGDLEQATVNQGLQLMETKAISHIDELEEMVKKITQHKEDVPKTTREIWKRMMSEESGIMLPRKEGMEEFYGKQLDPDNPTSPTDGGIIQNRLKEIAKKMGVSVEFIDITVKYGAGKDLIQKAVIINPELKKKAETNGWPLLGIPALLLGKEIMEEKENKSGMDKLFSPSLL